MTNEGCTHEFVERETAVEADLAPFLALAKAVQNWAEGIGSGPTGYGGIDPEQRLRDALAHPAIQRAVAPQAAD